MCRCCAYVQGSVAALHRLVTTDAVTAVGFWTSHNNLRTDGSMPWACLGGQQGSNQGPHMQYIQLPAKATAVVYCTANCHMLSDGVHSHSKLSLRGSTMGPVGHHNCACHNPAFSYQ